MAKSPANMLVIGTNIGGIRTLDPAANNARTVSELMSNAYDNLLMTRPESIDKLEPMLATEWTVSADGKTITLKMRDDATFSSGNPVTAEDAAWSIQRIIKMGQVGSTDLALWGFTKDNVDKLVRAEDAAHACNRAADRGEHRPRSRIAGRFVASASSTRRRRLSMRRTATSVPPGWRPIRRAAAPSC